MSVSPGSRLGPYVVGERVASGRSGEWFEGSEASLDRPVSLLVTPLPGEDDAASALRERARRLAALTDARLLPIYGQGEDSEALWLATRQLAGRSFAEIGTLERGRAALLGSQLARQLGALQEAGLTPEAVAPEDVVIEGEGEHERAWLLPNPGHPIGTDASGATRSLAALLDDRVGKPLLAEAPADPQGLADQLAPLAAPKTRSRRRLLVVGAVAVLVLALAALLAVVLARGDDEQAADPNAPIATTTARIPLGAAVAMIEADEKGVWAATTDSALIHVDPGTNNVTGTPLELFPNGAYVTFAADGDSVWVGGPGKIARLDSASGDVAETKRIGSRAASGLLVTDDSLLATLNEGSEIAATLVRFRRGREGETAIGEPFGLFPVPVLSDGDIVYAIGGDGGFSKVDSGGTVTTVGTGGQGGYPTVHGGLVWVPTRIDRTLVVVDPARMKPLRALHFEGDPLRAVTGAGSIWVLTQNPSMLHRVDPSTVRLVGAPLPVPTGASVVRFGAGSVWVDDPKGKALLRLAPTAPAPAAQPAERAVGVLKNGPVQPGSRLRVTSVMQPFSIVAPDDGWIAEGLTVGSLWMESVANHPRGAGVYVLTRAFDKSGRLVPVRSASDFLGILRRNPGLRVGRATHVKVGGLDGLRVRIDADPKPPFPAFCPEPCTAVFPIDRGTFILAKGVAEFTFVKRKGALFLVDAEFGRTVDPTLERRIRTLVSSIRFED